MTDRTLILTPPRIAGYSTLALDDSRRRGESPVALRIDTPDALKLAERWIDVAERLVVYSDFDLPDEAWLLVADAETMGLQVEIRTLGTRPRRTIRERIGEMLA